MLFLWDWQLQESFWMPFLVKICVNCKGGCKPEDRGHFYSTLELVSMNNLRVTSVKKQMSNTNWQLYFKPGPVHFQKVSLVVFLSEFWNLTFPLLHFRGASGKHIFSKCQGTLPTASDIHKHTVAQEALGRAVHYSIRWMAGAQAAPGAAGSLEDGLFTLRCFYTLRHSGPERLWLDKLAPNEVGTQRPGNGCTHCCGARGKFSGVLS